MRNTCGEAVSLRPAARDAVLVTGRVRAYLGVSVDGRIAGPDDDLGWLERPRERQASSPVPVGPDGWVGYEEHMASVGALLMGRRTFDMVSGFDGWPYGDVPVLVATSRDLPEGRPSTVRRVTGSTAEVVAAAREVAADRDVYVDGGRLVSAVLEAGLLDELTTTLLPTVVGPGVGLFDGLRGGRDLDLVRLATSEDGAVQLTWAPHR